MTTGTDEWHRYRSVRDATSICYRDAASPAGAAGSHALVSVEVFIDEGKRGGYLLCAAVVPSADVAAARPTMRALKPGNRRRLHMHSQGSTRRQQILARFLAAPPISAAQLWRAPIRGRPERDSRDDCFRELVEGVLDLGVRRIVVKSCSQDRQDERVIGESPARAGAIRRVSYSVVPAKTDELLRAADVITWAYGAGGDARRAVAGLLTVHDLAHMRKGRATRQTGGLPASLLRLLASAPSSSHKPCRPATVLAPN